jgi:hypothetical protein
MPDIVVLRQLEDDVEIKIDPHSLWGSVMLVVAHNWKDAEIMGELANQARCEGWATDEFRTLCESLPGVTVEVRHA